MARCNKPYRWRGRVWQINCLLGQRSMSDGDVMTTAKRYGSWLWLTFPINFSLDIPFLTSLLMAPGMSRQATMIWKLAGEFNLVGGAGGYKSRA